MLKIRQQAGINAALANVPFGETACSGAATGSDEESGVMNTGEQLRKISTDLLTISARRYATPGTGFGGKKCDEKVGLTAKGERAERRGWGSDRRAKTALQWLQTPRTWSWLSRLKSQKWAFPSVEP